jgi:hypothetical protein
MKYFFKFSLLLLLLLITVESLAQQGGQSAYRFVQLPVSARLNGLGGVFISHANEDASIAAVNPALLNKNMHQSLSFNHQFYFAGIQHGYFNYAHHLEKQRTTLHAGFQYMRYGDFRLTDEFDQDFGTFNAGEFAFIVGASTQVYERLTVGLNLKMINSALETYTAFALGADLAAVYHIEENDLTAALVISNMGATLNKYVEGQKYTMPYDVRLGLSKKLSRAPIILSINSHHLHRWNLLYDNPEQDDRNLFDNNQQTGARYGWVDNLFRHLVFSAEILIGKQENFRIRAGYNHFRRRELTVRNFRGLSGISAGFGFKVNRFRIDYGFGTYHLAGSSHHLSISTNLKQFTKAAVLD